MRQGEIFRKIRIERGFSQDKLTEGLCSRSTLASFETKGSYLSVELCSKFLDRLNVKANTYFNLISEDYDSKQKSFTSLKKNINSGNSYSVEEAKILCYEKYVITQDMYWFHLYFLAVEYLESLKDDFSYEHFQLMYEDDIQVIKSYLFKVENWDHFEFALFSNSVWYFDMDFVLLMTEKLKSNFDVYNQERQILYAKYFINYGFYCLEFGHFNRLKAIKEELYKSATYETLHWKIIASFQYAFAKELLGESSNESTLDSINHYLAFGEQTYYDDIILYRQRLLKKHKAN